MKAERRRIESFGQGLLETFGACKRTVIKCWRFAERVVLSILSRNHSPKGSTVEAGYGLVVEVGNERMDLREFASALPVGDRIRVLCDDGIVVAQKVSPTQFKLLDLQIMSESIH